MSVKPSAQLEVIQIIIRLCDECKDWFKLEVGPMACPKCGGETRTLYMVPKADQSTWRIGHKTFARDPKLELPIRTNSPQWKGPIG